MLVALFEPVPRGTQKRRLYTLNYSYSPERFRINSQKG